VLPAARGLPFIANTFIFISPFDGNRILFSYGAVLQQHYPGGFAFAAHFVGPYANLHTAYMRFFKQQHGKPALAYAAAYRRGVLAVCQRPVVRQAKPPLTAGCFKLAAQGIRAYANAHTAYLYGTVQQVAMVQQVSV
jgi:hypothetical protein